MTPAFFSLVGVFLLQCFLVVPWSAAIGSFTYFAIVNTEILLPARKDAEREREDRLFVEFSLRDWETHDTDCGSVCVWWLAGLVGITWPS